MEFDTASRLHPHLLAIATLMACVSYAVRAIIHGNTSDEPSSEALLGSARFPLNVRIPLHRLISGALDGTVPEYIEIGFSAASTPSVTDIPGLQGVLRHIVAPQFVLFYENHLPWLETNLGPDGARWPPTLDFARVLRNSASHAFKLTFRQSTSRAVEWRGLRYDPTHHGHTAIGKDLSTADLIILMIDMTKEYDQLGCPVLPS